mmetsp:Transcript_23062/g.37953  ORF Transcript_23062/g.37953 Transcript_23062/m.37953 type:complete len:89 (-) Transcript_23062:443-709(-)
MQFLGATHFLIVGFGMQLQNIGKGFAKVFQSNEKHFQQQLRLKAETCSLIRAGSLQEMTLMKDLKELGLHGLECIHSEGDLYKPLPSS